MGADKILVAKARRKLADRELERLAMTQAMLNTPRALNLTRDVEEALGYPGRSRLK